MKIEVHFHTTLQPRTLQGWQRETSVELPPGSRLLDLLQALQLELDPEQVLLVVDSKLVDVDHILADGERVSLIPAMSGG